MGLSVSNLLPIVNGHSNIEKVLGAGQGSKTHTWQMN